MVPYCKGTSLEGNTLPTMERSAIINFAFMKDIIEIREGDFQVDV
jgi:FAD/FMN-containing dehydrogenase